MKLLMTTTFLFASVSVTFAQGGNQPDIFNNVGPSGTRIQHELPISSYQYHSTTTCDYSYRYRFRVYKGSTLKIDETFDVNYPQGPTEYYRTVDFTGWNLVVGDVVTYYSYAVILVGPYTGKYDRDLLYGDVVDLYSRAPSSPTEENGSFLVAATDEKNRFETLFA